MCELSHTGIWKTCWQLGRRVRGTSREPEANPRDQTISAARTRGRASSSMIAHIGAHLAAEHPTRPACIYEFARVAQELGG